MKLTIVAATGGIGAQLLAQATAAGHEVTALVRSPGKLRSTPARAVVADLATARPADLDEAVAGADAVLSGLGPTRGADPAVAWRGTQALVAAMASAGAQRILAVSAAPIGTVPSPARPQPPRRDPGDGLLMAYLLIPGIKVALRNHYAALARMEDVLRGSGLEWTIVRPPRLTDGPMMARYRTAYGQNVSGGWSISRADVAHFMLAAVNQPGTVGQVVGIAN